MYTCLICGGDLEPADTVAEDDVVIERFECLSCGTYHELQTIYDPQTKLMDWEKMYAYAENGVVLKEE